MGASFSQGPTFPKEHRAAKYRRIQSDGMKGAVTGRGDFLLEFWTVPREVESGHELQMGVTVPADVAEGIARWILKVREDARPVDVEPESPGFEEERAAFVKLKPLLVEIYPDRFVAVHGGKVVDSHPDEATLTARFFDTYGDVPVYIGRVTQEDEAIMMPTFLGG